jgi:uncharacterized damage-inducible protein DinB
MAIRDGLLPEFDHEMANTRKTLERVPEDKLSFKPHPKSMSMGQLAGHVAEIPTWGALTIEKDSFDVSPVGGESYKPFVMTSRKELLEKFDKNIAAARAAIAGASDEHLMKTWTLLAGGKTVFAQPRIGVVRGMVFSHMIHHRAQLGVYLRLNDVPVPAIYGPSADEKNF